MSIVDVSKVREKFKERRGPDVNQNEEEFEQGKLGEWSVMIASPCWFLFIWVLSYFCLNQFFPFIVLSPRNLVKLEDIPTEQELTALLLASLKKTRDGILDKVGHDGQIVRTNEKKKKGKREKI